MVLDQQEFKSLCQKIADELSINFEDWNILEEDSFYIYYAVFSNPELHMAFRLSSEDIQNIKWEYFHDHIYRSLYTEVLHSRIKKEE